MPLQITDRQRVVLQNIRKSNPGIADLAADVAAAFNENDLDNPEFAMVILEAICKRVADGVPGAVASLIGHLENFGTLGCLQTHQVIQFSIRALQLGCSVQPRQKHGAGEK